MVVPEWPPSSWARGGVVASQTMGDAIAGNEVRAAARGAGVAAIVTGLRRWPRIAGHALRRVSAAAAAKPPEPEAAGNKVGAVSSSG